MKWYRRIYIAALIVLLFGGWITGYRVWFIGLFVGLGLLIFAVILNVWTAVSFTFDQKISGKGVTRGEKFQYNLDVFNDKPYPFTMMNLTVAEPGNQDRYDHLFQVHLPSREHAEYQTEMDARYRGKYTLGLKTLQVSDIFGLTSFRYQMKRFSWYQPINVTVYPRIFELPFLKMKLQDEKQWSAADLKLRDDGESFAGTRAYQPGDRLSRIHWKMVAKERELYTRQYEIPKQGETVILLDNCNNVFEGEEQLAFETFACETAAALAKLHLDQNQRTTLYLSSRTVKLRGQSSGDFSLFHETLAEIPFDSQNATEEMMLHLHQEAAEASTCYVIAPHYSESMQDEIKKLKNLSVQVFPICVCPSGQPVSGTDISLVTRGEDIEKLGGGLK